MAENNKPEAKKSGGSAPSPTPSPSPGASTGATSGSSTGSDVEPNVAIKVSWVGEILNKTKSSATDNGGGTEPTLTKAERASLRRRLLAPSRLNRNLSIGEANTSSSSSEIESSIRSILGLPDDQNTTTNT